MSINTSFLSWTFLMLIFLVGNPMFSIHSFIYLPNSPARSASSSPSSSALLSLPPESSPSTLPPSITTIPGKSNPIVSDSRKDNFIERFVIRKLSSAVLTLLPERGQRKWKLRQRGSFDDFVAITKEVLHSSSTINTDVSDRVVTMLRTMLPKPIVAFFRFLVNVNKKLMCELSSVFIRMGFLTWLIGPTKRSWVKVSIGEEDQHQQQQWHSGVAIEKCRYLDRAQCKGACLYLCKIPTEDYFRQEMGLPVYMKPNFEDKSCEIFFGVSPPDRKEDPSLKEGCYSDCAGAARMRKNETITSISSA
eukprot:gene1704-1862_t